MNGQQHAQARRDAPDHTTSLHIGGIVICIGRFAGGPAVAIYPFAFPEFETLTDVDGPHDREPA